MSKTKLSPGGRQYILKHDDPNHPDKIYRKVTIAPTTVLPATASNTFWMGSIRDQGQEGSCTGQMKAEYRDFNYRKFYNTEKNKAVAPASFMASAAFAYVTNLIADGDLGKDNGSTIHQSFVTMSQLGVCLNSLDPYTGTNDYTKKPTTAQYANALLYAGGPYYSLPTLGEVKMFLAAGYAVGIGINVYESFESDAFAANGFMPMPKASEQLLGGHAQLVLAYSDTVQFPDTGKKGGVFVQNSWGTSWGRSSFYQPTARGCYWMPYDFFTYNDPSGNGLGVSDMWSMHF